MKVLKLNENKQWNKNHILNWKSHLETDKKGFTLFQKKMFDKLKQELMDNSISFSKEITEHKDLNDENRIVKMITLTLDKYQKSKFWIYHDMVDFIINNKSQIFEEWEYLNPEDLIFECLKSTRELLKLIKNKAK